MSEDKCKSCGGLNDRKKLGEPVCTRCFQDALRANFPEAPTGKLLVISTPKGTVPKNTMAAIHEAVEGQECVPVPKLKPLASGPVNVPKIPPPMKMRYPRGVCQKCGNVLAKGSNSYCREHERERLKEWRKKQNK